MLVPILLQAQKVRTLSETIELRMPSKKHGGTNGAAVTYHSAEGKYYACFAGNSSYPLAVFNEAGKRISKENLEGMIDSRGIWYNDKMNTICGKAHSKKAWYKYTLEDGIPTSQETYTKASHRTSNQSIAAYNTKRDLVYLLSGKFIEVYYEDGQEDKDELIRIYPGITRKDDIADSDKGDNLDSEYNDNVVVYTGMRKAEFGLLNYQKKQIELYNRKNGLLTKILKLPKSVTTYDSFNFSYANGIFWLYNQRLRTWIGYE